MRDYYVKYLIFCIIFSMFFFKMQLQGEIIVYDCDGVKLQPRKSDIGDNHRNKAEKIIQEINSNNCLPNYWKDLINQMSKNNEISIQLTCDPNFKCGETTALSDEITIPKYYSNWQSSCGCEEATLLHEMLHAWIPDTPDGDKKIRGCEVKCTANIPRCQKYPPSGQACDCPK